MIEYKAILGDIFLCDSDRTGAKIVKFLMTAPTVWQWIWRYMMNTQQVVRYYHAGIIVSDTQLIEQQAHVQWGDTQKILSRRITIYRKKSLTEDQRLSISHSAVFDIGQGYGVVSCIGKLFTWLTGIKWFEIHIHQHNDEICINRVCLWYSENNLETFGLKNYRDANTKIVDEYCAKSPDWEAVYYNE